MGMLWEVEGQDQWFGARVLDLNATICQGRLSDKPDFRVDLTEPHIPMIPDFQLTNAAASAIRMKQRWALRAERRLAAWLHGESQNGALLIPEEVSVNDPLRIDAFAEKFLGSDRRSGILQHEVGILIGCEIKLLNEVFPVFVTVFRIVLFPARVKGIRGADASVQRQVLGQKVLIHRHVKFMRA
ncbi:MAG: hypothetical protein RLZZ232_1714, partial [Planctomycetota bacterium]